ncbi:hypothetical protein ACA910_003563 [Epithemia clementina (nom. ined.)]
MTTTTTSTTTGWYSAAVDRSPELLSCFQSALKILQQQLQQQQQQQQQQGRTNQTNYSYHNNNPQLHEYLVSLSPKQLQLASTTTSTSSTTTTQPASPLFAWQDECLLWLHELEQTCRQLQSLVRRLGQSNDPTHDISRATQRFQHAAQQLNQVLLEPPSSQQQQQRQQRHKHVQGVQDWCRTVAQHWTHTWDQTMKVRAQSLKARAQRQEQFRSSSSSSSSSKNNKPPPQLQSPLILERNPLFTQPAPPRRPTAAQSQSPRRTLTQNGHSNTVTTTTTPTPLATPHHQQSYYHPAGYGGVVGTAHNTNTNMTIHTGMRRRPTAAAAAATTTTRNGGGNSSRMIQDYQQHDVVDPNAYVVQQQHQQQQQQQQQQQRNLSTHRRLRDARQAEQTLHSLGHLFGQMSSLVAQQGEVLEKVEDDVEAASLDVQAGHDEIATLYSLQKGNRALILKVFGVLIFLIVFLRLYKK